jgi:hypothetical protein
MALNIGELTLSRDAHIVAQLVFPVTDLSISVIVTVYLAKSRSGFNSNTETVLKKLLTVTWSAGIPPTISATLDMITFLTMQVRICGLSSHSSKSNTRNS